MKKAGILLESTFFHFGTNFIIKDIIMKTEFLVVSSTNIVIFNKELNKAVNSGFKIVDKLIVTVVSGELEYTIFLKRQSNK